MIASIFRPDVRVVFLAASLLFVSQVYGQAPDWMFALEGTYVGRYEMPTGEGENMRTVDARMDGKRSGAEDGFVLQFARESENGIVKEAQMWSWNASEGALDVTAIQDGQRNETQWFAEPKGLAVNLTRGGAVDGAAAIERLRLERLPGQLRLTKQYNLGDGEWTLQWRYILDDFVAED
jgi:hypothetical protein